MQRKVILSADSTCDLGEALKEKYRVNYYPFLVILGDQQYHDGVNISPDDIYKTYNERKILPKTAAIGVGEYASYFRKWTEQGYDVVHVNIGSGLSSSYQNCCLAAKELEGHVYPIDSCNLSSATGLLALEAARRIEAGMPAKQVQLEVSALAPKLNTSFILDTLKFLHAGGRCSGVAALGANLLKLRPCIEVDSIANGKMGLGKKYRGDLNKVIPLYIDDKLGQKERIDPKQIFVVHSGVSGEILSDACARVKALNYFEDVYISRAGCAISAHCGPGTLGLAFMQK